MAEHDGSIETSVNERPAGGPGRSGIGRRAFVGSAALLAAAAALGLLAGCSGASSDGASGSAAATSSEGASGSAAASSSEGGSEPGSGGASEQGGATTTASESPAASAAPAASAVVYFSLPRPDNPEIDAESGASVVLGDDGTVYGNVEWLARFVAQDAGADLVRIVPDEDYPSGIDDVLDLALAQQDAGEHPAVHLERELGDGSAETLASLDEYGTVYLGYPIWWYELPMPMMAFFDEYDLAGKTVYPFVVHGGSGFSGTVDDVASLEPGADVSRDGLSVNRRRVAAEAEQDAAEWVASLGTAAAQQ